MSQKNVALGLAHDRSFRPPNAKGHAGFKVHDTDVLGETDNRMHRFNGDPNTKVRRGDHYLGPLPTFVRVVVPVARPKGPTLFERYLLSRR